MQLFSPYISTLGRSVAAVRPVALPFATSGIVRCLKNGHLTKNVQKNGQGGGCPTFCTAFRNRTVAIKFANVKTLNF